MISYLRYKIIVARNKENTAVVFILICTAAFIVSIITTIYFCNTMDGDMYMPGDWRMSMMWMRMPGETWFASLLGFILMWLAMMFVMMIPSALPMFLKTSRQLNRLCCMAVGYFTIWLIAGAGICLTGAMLANAAMHSITLSSSVPLISGIVLIITGVYQFTEIKITKLKYCRTSFGCAISTARNKTGFWIGCEQGIVCCACCWGLMTAQLILGIMNPLSMIVIAIAITAEKLLARPEITVKLIGIIAIVTGIIFTMK